jgi:hypothetical protein
MLFPFHIFCQAQIVHKFKNYSNCTVSSGLRAATARKFISALGLKIAATLWDGKSGFRIPVGIRDFSFLQKVETFSGVTLLSIRWVSQLFPAGKATTA